MKFYDIIFAAGGCWGAGEGRGMGAAEMTRVLGENQDGRKVAARDLVSYERLFSAMWSSLAHASCR